MCFPECVLQPIKCQWVGHKLGQEGHYVEKGKQKTTESIILWAKSTIFDPTLKACQILNQMEWIFMYTTTKCVFNSLVLVQRTGEVTASSLSPIQ